MIKVRVVCEGYLRREHDIVVEAHSTSTLVLAGSHRVLVDTSTPYYRDRLLQGLRAEGSMPEDVDTVVSTHLHHDHIGNNDLFPRAVKLAREEEEPGPGYRAIRTDQEVLPGVFLMHTPGHTRGSMSVVVEAEDARYVMAGDAIPTQDNFEKWAPPRTNIDREMALDSMQRIAEVADIIVPGHGAAFRPERVRR